LEKFGKEKGRIILFPPFKNLITGYMMFWKGLIPFNVFYVIKQELIR
jgi:hypothetical protein